MTALEVFLSGVMLVNNATRFPEFALKPVRIKKEL